MADYRNIEKRLMKSLGIERRPVAVKSQDSAPGGVKKFTGTQPAGCAFWRLAAEGRTFYTVPADHYNCPIGSYTHNIPLPPERAQDLEQTLSLMVSIGYVRMEEVPGIPRLPQTPGVVIYAPLGETPVDPDVIIFAGQAGEIMLLQEAAQRARCAAQIPLLGRPTCMALPAAMTHGAVMSTACIGNRIYTGLDMSELYVAVPGKDLAKIMDEIETVASANAQLAEYHRGRREALATE